MSWLLFAFEHRRGLFHTEILLHGREDALSISPLCFRFYLTHPARRAGVLPCHGVITHSEPALDTTTASTSVRRSRRLTSYPRLAGGAL